MQGAGNPLDILRMQGGPMEKRVSDERSNKIKKLMSRKDKVGPHAVCKFKE